MPQRTEYDLGADGKLFLAYGDGYIIQPDHSKKRKDHIYTGIRGGEKDLILSHKREEIGRASCRERVSSPV